MLSKAVRWLLPHPFLTLLLAVVWTLLQNDVSPGMVVFGVTGGAENHTFGSFVLDRRPVSITEIPQVELELLLCWIQVMED